MSSNPEQADLIVDMMLNNDAFSRWLGIKVVDILPGYLIVNDYVRLDVNGVLRTMRVASINSAGRLSLAEHQEANVDARNRDPNGVWRYTYKQAGSLLAAKARRITVSPIGEVNDPGFRG